MEQCNAWNDAGHNASTRATSVPCFPVSFSASLLVLRALPFVFPDSSVDALSSWLKKKEACTRTRCARASCTASCALRTGSGAAQL
eukprot:12227530-Prorocentrum_lima.AAC.1